MLCGVSFPFEGSEEERLYLHGVRSPRLEQTDGRELSGPSPQMVAAEESVPEAEDSGKVRVEAAWVEGVVTAVHPWGDDEPFDTVLNGEGDAEIAVVELGTAVHEDFEGNQPPEGWPPGKDHEALDRAGNDQFADVEPCSGRDIYLRVAVVRLVEAPQEPDPVVHAMHPVIPEIEDDHRG